MLSHSTNEHLHCELYINRRSNFLIKRNDIGLIKGVRSIFRLLLLTIISLIFTLPLFSQIATQTIKGNVIDKDSEFPIIGATVILLSRTDTIGTITDSTGYFVIPNAKVGRHSILINYLGYTPLEIPEILITAGKEFYLDAAIEESFYNMALVTVTAKLQKDKPINAMAAVSARSFSLEEVTRYSGARNDVSRMLANFAGVTTNSDSRNDLVIRGNSPVGVLWRLEGVAIPSPNHFSTLGATGGPVSALNTNLLSNSDFLTGAFPAEYGNANAGVFDVNFRNGNKDKFEFTAQLAAFNGIEFMAEGPLSKKKKGSFLASYRRSFMELVQKTGFDVGTTATPTYQDLSFKVVLGETKLGRLSFFGIGANSKVAFLAEETNPGDLFASSDRNSYATSRIGILGLKHLKFFDNNAHLKTTLAVSTTQNEFIEEVINNQSNIRDQEIDDQVTRYTLSTLFNKKFNARHRLRIGIINEFFQLNNTGRMMDNGLWQTFRSFNGEMNLIQFFAQSKYKITKDLIFNLGLHSQVLTFNGDYSVEPRMALTWQIAPNKSINFGFGVHEQMLPLPVYLQTQSINGQQVLINKDINFSRSTQFVVSYDQSLGTDWRLKLEMYYQDMSQIPVDIYPSSFSALNLGSTYQFPETEALINEGNGKNYGIEYTLEKFFSNDYYGLLTGSFFQSKYIGSDGVQRNTAFNNQYITNLLVGKEFRIGDKRRNAITLDLKFAFTGGRYYTPIDLEQSKIFNTEIRKYDSAYSERYNPYLNLNLRIGYQHNSHTKKISQQFYLELTNITNHKNVFSQRYDSESQKIITIYQLGLFPDLLYRIQF